MIRNVLHIRVAGILPSRYHYVDLFFEPRFLTGFHVRTLDLDKAFESVPEFREQAFLIGAFRRVRFRHM